VSSRWRSRHNKYIGTRTPTAGSILVRASKAECPACAAWGRKPCSKPQEWPGPERARFDPSETRMCFVRTQDNQPAGGPQRNSRRSAEKERGGCGDRCDLRLKAGQEHPENREEHSQAHGPTGNRQAHRNRRISLNGSPPGCVPHPHEEKGDDVRQNNRQHSSCEARPTSNPTWRRERSR